MSARFAAVFLSLAVTHTIAGGVESPDPAVLQEGDIIVCSGTGYWSRHFRESSLVERRFSHVGIVTRGAEGWEVVHALASHSTGAGSVRVEPVGVFLAGATDWAVHRLRETPEVRAAVAAAARGFVGVAFDASFDLGDASRVYCTELVWLAVNRATGRTTIEPASHFGRHVVHIDACYLGPAFEPVSEAAPQRRKRQPPPSGGGSSNIQAPTSKRSSDEESRKP